MNCVIMPGRKCHFQKRWLSHPAYKDWVKVDKSNLIQTVQHIFSINKHVPRQDICEQNLLLGQFVEDHIFYIGLEQFIVTDDLIKSIKYA